MESKPLNKPYFIELYSGSQQLANKFKFVLSASTVKQLRTLIHEKLVNKQSIKSEEKLILKDTDDFELASDDQLQDVLPDAKVRIYINSGSQPQHIIQPQVVVPPPPPFQQPQPIPAPAVVGASQINLNLVTKNTVLDLSKLTIPNVAAQTKMRLRIHCPQIRNTIIEIPFEPSLDSYLELSRYIVSQLGIDKSLKALLYNSKGQPFLYNIDLMHSHLPKLDFSEQLYVVFTASPSVVDQQIVEPPVINSNISSVTVVKGLDKYTIEVDLSNTLEVLKYKIFKTCRIHPQNQIIKFANKPLINPVETLSSYGIKDNSIVELYFKLTSNLVPSTFADKFYYKDIVHTRIQQQPSLIQLRSHLLLIAAHLSDDDKVRLPYFFRGMTKNMPLVYALKCLMRNNFISQCHRIALEEGLLLALSEYIRGSTLPMDQLQYGNIFTHLRDFLDYVIEGMKKLTNIQEIKECEEDVEVQPNCHFTIKPIVHPCFIKLDNKQIVLVDKKELEEQIMKGFTYPLLTAPKKDDLFAPKDLDQFYHHYRSNQIDNPNTNALYWIGFKAQHPNIVLPPVGTVDQFKGKLDSYPNMKVHQPLEIKNKTSTYLLLNTKDNKLRIFVSKNKDISKPYNIYNVLTGEEEAVNLDIMGANVTSQNVEEAIDMANFKPVITREPKQAIAVLFDISGSMGSRFFNEPDLKRIGAVKSFFEAFAYRTIAYNFQHVVSLFFFDNKVDNQCGFTEAIYDFNRLVAQATPRASTLMYDAIVVATNSLKAFQAKYPNCLLRILALTDGEDTGSHHSIEQTTQLVIKNNIIIDAFAVGTNCEGLKVITKASGGKCYLTRHLEESLKLFEQETVLSVRTRKLDVNQDKLSLTERIQKAKLQPFDLPANVHQFNMPKSQGGGLSTKEILKKMEGSEESKKIQGNASLKRIAKQIQRYSENPHPFVAIFPCANINLWKILLLGPKETPYQNGLFLLYAQFPGDYPFKAPEVRFITPIYHCNMNSQGRICHSVFDRNYSPAITFRQIIDCVYGLILTPEPEDPLDNVIASFYLSEYQTYYKKAVTATKQKASASIESIVDELFGKIVDDIERKKKEKEIEEWITLAKSFN